MKIGFVLFDNLTQLDLTGPLQVLHRLPGAQTLLLSHTLGPVMSDCGLALMPDTPLSGAPQLDMICVPGGPGVAAAMDDTLLRTFLRDQAVHCRYVTSVCTGAFILGASGLLKGRKATTHWAYHDLLPLLGARPVHQRVVHDLPLITGGGVTAGIDFALEVAAEIAGVAVAQSIQLALEYDPAPRFDAGSPSRAPQGVREELGRAYEIRRNIMRDATRRAAARLGH